MLHRDLKSKRWTFSGWPELGPLREKLLISLIRLRQTKLRLGILRIAFFFVRTVLLYLCQAFGKGNGIHLQRGCTVNAWPTLPHFMIPESDASQSARKLAMFFDFPAQVLGRVAFCTKCRFRRESKYDGLIAD